MTFKTLKEAATVVGMLETRIKELESKVEQMKPLTAEEILAKLGSIGVQPRMK